MTEWSENAVWNDSGQELCGCTLSHETGNFGGIVPLHWNAVFLLDSRSYDRTVAGMLDFTGPIPVDPCRFLQEWGGAL